jgi:PAS domain S-box-containing protein
MWPNGEGGRAAYCLSLLLLALLAASPCPARAQARPQGALADKHILVLHAHEANAPLFIDTDRALSRTLQGLGLPFENQSFHSLDLRHNPSAAYRQLLVEQMRLKYSHRNLDLIVTMYPEALDFVLGDAQHLFPGTPVLALYLPPGTKPSPAGRRVFTHTADLDVVGTLEIALRLMPDARRVLVVSGDHPFDQAYAARARLAFKRWDDRLEFRFLTRMPLEEILAVLASAPPGTVVLLLSYARDVTGKTYLSPDFTQRLRRVSAAPIFGLLEVTLGHGIVGGMLFSFEHTGANAARLAAEILQGGRRSGNVGSSLDVPPLPMFDWRELKRWKLAVDAVPPGSVIINREYTLWEQYRGQVIAAVALVIAQALLIMGLLIQRRERRVAEAALQANEERLRLAAQAAALGVWSYDIRQNKIRTNSTYHPHRELSYADALARVHAEDRARLDGIVQEAIRTGRDYEVEYRVMLPDGTTRWMASRGKCTHDRTGGPLALNGVTLDITERKRAELSLRESERRFRMMADAAPVMIWMAGPDKGCNYFNAGWLAFTGRSREQETGSGWVEGVHPDDVERCIQRYSQAFDGRESFEMEYRLRRFDGEYRWILDLGTPLHEEDGRFIGYIGSCYDITDRKRAEGDRMLLASVVESSHDAIISLDRDFRITSWNPAAERLLGYGPAETMGQPIWLIVPPELREDTMLVLQGVLDGVPAGWDSQRCRKDGTRVHVSIAAAPIKDAAGEVLGMSAVLRDITERKRADEALKESERKYRDLYESLQDGFVLIGMDGTIRQFNEAFRAMTGYTAAELSRMTYFDLTPAKWHAAERAIVEEQVLPRGYSELYEKEYRRKDGTVFPVELRRLLLRDAGGGYAMWAIVRDITDRRRAELSLRESEERFRQVAETVGDFIWEVDATGLYRYTSPAVEQILGYAPDELVGKAHFYDLFVPDMREALKVSAFRTFAAKGPFRGYRNLNLHKSGRVVELETSGVPVLDESGNLLGYRGVDTDVTARRRAELETERLRRDLAHISRVTLMGELTGSLAHELNQPLTAIASNAYAGERYLAAPTPRLAEVREILQDIAADARRAGEVIHRTRTLLKKDPGRFRLLDLNEVIREVVALTRTDAIIRHQPIELQLAPDLPPVMGDRVQLQQVLLNLVLNGMDAMAAQPPEARRLTIQTAPEAATVRVGVHDHGPGIPADRLEQIFATFFTTKPHGMGMGLAISRSIVEVHGGKIWAENHLDGGATFWFTLPLTSSPEQAPERPEREG